VVVFVSNHLGVIIDYRWFRGSGTFDNVGANSRTISVGIAFRR
jgi:hypothetical protein